MTPRQSGGRLEAETVPEPLLEFRNVTKRFSQRDLGEVVAVSNVSFALRKGETVALIGESGSGKSTVGRLCLGLLAPSDGRIFIYGRDIGAALRRDLRALRAEVGVVFQEPLESLNPRMRVLEAVEEPLEIHARHIVKAERRARAAEALESVSLDPTVVGGRYPKALSGGQQQRVSIARALVTRPKFVVLDEPTASLDVSVQAQVLGLLRKLQRQFSLTVLFITHDLKTAKFLSNRVIVMHRGNVVESGRTDRVLDRPLHPYTQALLSSILSVDPGTPRAPVRLFNRGTTVVTGCTLSGRCPVELPECASTEVPLTKVDAMHEVRCLRVRG